MNYELRIKNLEFPNIVSFKFISEPDKGIYDAMNKGIDMATGEWINFMNAGDRFCEKNTIQQLFDAVNVKADIIYGNTNIVFNKKSYISYPKSIVVKNNYMPFCHQAGFVRTLWMQKLKFDVSYKIAADRKFFKEMYIQKRTYQYISITVCNYEAESGVSSINNLEMMYEFGLIDGQTQTIKWRIKYYWCMSKQVIKKMLPTSIVKYIREKNIIQNHKMICIL